MFYYEIVKTEHTGVHPVYKDERTLPVNLLLRSAAHPLTSTENTEILQFEGPKKRVPKCTHAEQYWNTQTEQFQTTPP